MTPFQKHVLDWKNCTLCPLHRVRHKVVLAKGSLPCDALFIGEAPGGSENALGIPFVGPAGKLLDLIVHDAFRGLLRVAFTNLVGCIPKDETDKLPQPPKESIEACTPRLREFIGIANPSFIVAVGELADEYLPGIVETGVPWIKITHPAAIIRQDVSRRGLSSQRCIVDLTEMAESMGKL